MKNRLKIIVLAGGVSEERDVSLTSAKAISESLIRLKHDINVIDTANGQPLLDDNQKFILEEDPKSLSKIALKQTDSLTLVKTLDSKYVKSIDLVFLALHGGIGENGVIQALLEQIGLIYTGAKRMASSVAMNKAYAKKIMQFENIVTPNWILLKIKNQDEINTHIDRINETFKFPVIVKPNDSGSTVGLTLVKKYGQLQSALESCFKVSKEILLEEYIKGREITASVLNNESLPLVEIIPTGELYDYHCKYTKGGSNYICPAEIPDDITDKIKSLALKAYQAIECSGLARVDFILDEDNQPYFLEINTLPGMTELSLAPMAAKVAGISFDELIEKICQSALSE